MAKAGNLPLETIPPMAPSRPTSATSTFEPLSSTHTQKLAIAAPHGNQVCTTSSPAFWRVSFASRSAITM